MKTKTKDSLSFEEAMETLAGIGGLELDSPPSLWIVQGKKLTFEREVGSGEGVEWLAAEGIEEILAILERCYRVLHLHILDLLSQPEIDWEEEKNRRGVVAMMTLVGESVPKMEGYLSIRLAAPCKGKVAEGEEFRALQRLYQERFSQWIVEEKKGRDFSEAGFTNFDAILNDQEYELFYIRNEAGKPYYDREMLRNIQLKCDFAGEDSSFEEDPLLQVRSMQDRDLYASARQILNECHGALEEFYKLGRKGEGNALASQLGMAAIALFLAANSQHLLHTTKGKSCLDYFHDFAHFLREALTTPEYQKWLAYPPGKGEPEGKVLLQLAHSLVLSLFHHPGGIKQEMIGLIHRTMRRGEELKKEKKGGDLFSRLLSEDEQMRTLLKQFPNGPLFKVLDLVREEKELTFDPIEQGSYPFRLYELGDGVEVLKIASPTRQSLIHKAEVVEEFYAFLRAIGRGGSNRKLLMINLQDRTSSREFARAKALEQLQKNAEFNPHLVVLTLPKSTDFYYQANEYLDVNQAGDFFAALEAQMEDPESFGYFFPSHKAEFASYAKEAIRWIHTEFFEKKKFLERGEREDFIELFYQLLILKAIELYSPSYLSFTCKDGVDTGAAQEATLYGIQELLKGDLEKEKGEMLRWLLYAPALLIRERAIDASRLYRAISALSRFAQGVSKDRKGVLKFLKQS